MGEVVHEIEKNKAEVIRFSIDNFKEYNIVNCRVFAKTDSGTVPTKKGLAFSIRLLPDILRGFNKVKEVVKSGNYEEKEDYTR